LKGNSFERGMLKAENLSTESISGSAAEVYAAGKKRGGLQRGGPEADPDGQNPTRGVEKEGGQSGEKNSSNV